MITFGYQTPNKGNTLPADSFRLFGTGLGANRQVNWSVVLAGPTAANLSGHVNADASGNLDKLFASPGIQNYYSNPAMPKISGGNWSGDDTLTTFNTSAQNGGQSITLSATLV